ncbi:MAG: trypsin-like peptidase domain-containing protein [Ruminococcus sp.]|nr:trypsin-like peptidase domain-containing protein [Ruminococcus sp.]
MNNSNFDGYNGCNSYSMENDTAKESAKKDRSSKLKIAALAMSFSLLGGALGTGGTLAAMKAFNKDTANTNAAEETNKTAVIRTADSDGNKVVSTQTVKNDGKKLTAAEVYAANVNSTVGITTEITTNYFGYKTTAAASGSGFIITDDGYIVTNYHVIEGANKVKVTTYDNTSYDAEVVGTDENNDIAVLKIDGKDLTPVTLGSSESLAVGDDVVAIGNPLGELTFTLTSGVVSAMDRQITTGTSLMMDLIQTDCAINAGNSGGALFNMYGEVVGVTNAKYSSNSSTEASIDNIGFAIPIDTVKDIVTSIIEKGYVEKPYIGVGADTVDSDMVDYGLPEGAVIRTITEGSPAEKAGLQEKDIITKVNDTEIKEANDLVKVVRKSSKGDELTLSVYRQGEEMTIKVIVDESKPEEKDENEAEQQDEAIQEYRGGQGMEGFDPFEFFGMG